MPRKAQKEKFAGRYFTWLLGRRNGVWTADGRSNFVNLGRHSLGTRDREHALRELADLDLRLAVEHGRADRSALDDLEAEPLPLEKGKELYLAHAGRPRVARGVRDSSLKRYKAPLAKFVDFAAERGLKCWNQVRTETLESYAAWLEENEYAPKTQSFELTTLLQVVKWFAKAGHLPSGFKVDFTVEKPDGTDAYCWTEEEVVALREHCLATPGLAWMADAVWGLAWTGMRVNELAGLRSSNLDLASATITLIDESSRRCFRRKGRAAQTTKSGRRRTFPIHDELRPVLEGLSRHEDGFVFRGPDGGRLTDRLVRKGLKQAQSTLAERFPTPDGEQGFADGTPHSFRHFFCSMCANAGVPERMVMTWLGHRNSEMVRHYYHVRDPEARRQMARVSLGAKKSA